MSTRTSSLKQKDPGAIHHALVVSAEDDNIGILPQLTGQSVHRIIESLRQVGAHGFQTRQWMHSNLLPTFHYLGHPSWEKGWTPRRAYEHLYGPICGARAVPHVLRAFARLERITEKMHRETYLVSFPVPNWITGHWDSWPAKLTPQSLEQVARIYEQSADDLAKAVRASRPAGRDTLFALERHVRHGAYYCRSLAQMALARMADGAAEEAQKANRFEQIDLNREATATHLAEAETLMRRACEVFAHGVVDRCDLGALATLNSFNLDPIAALARLARAKADMFSCRES